MEIVVFTNGCFDLIHQGHIDLLKKARSLGTKLIVGLNSDESVRAIKGIPRPFLEQSARAAILKELRSVDEVLIFEENTPEKVIREIKPDVLVKGGDWTVEQIVGADFVLKNGGKVFSIPFENDISSSKIVEKIKITENYPAHPKIKITGSTDVAENSLKECIEVLELLLKQEILNIVKCAEMIFAVFARGNKVFLCGDIENAAYSEKLAEQLRSLSVTKGNFTREAFVKNITIPRKTGAKYELDEKPLSIQIEQIADKDDLLIAICHDENSTEITEGVMKARQIGCLTIGLTDLKAKKLISLCDAGIQFSIKSKISAEAAFNIIGQIWCGIIEGKISNSIKSQNGIIR